MKLRKIKGWIHKPTPASMNISKSMDGDSGWVGKVSEFLVNEALIYSVMIRSIETEWGIVEHASIRNAASTDICWSEKQRIKNEIFGHEAVAIEIFPKMSELVDSANMYHLWVMPDGFVIPFSIFVDA